MNLGTPIFYTAVYECGPQDTAAARPLWEADGTVCRHCGWMIQLRDAITKKPLPADACAERCQCCAKHICGKCKIKMNSGEICSYFRDRIDLEEYRFAERLKLGSW